MKKSKILAVLTCLPVVSTTVACGGTGDGNTLEITVQDAGYGVEWIADVALAYEENTGVKVELIDDVTSSLVETELNKLESGEHTSDVIMLSTDLYAHAEEGELLEITDSVYKQTPYGAEEGAATIAQRCTYNEAMKLNGEDHYYFMSFATAVVGLLYNETTLDAVYGAGQWTLPRTTNELITMLDYIKDDPNDKAYGFSSTSDYMNTLAPIWWAQYDGYNTYYDYWRGYQDGVFCYDDPTFANTTGRLKALQVLEKIIKQENGYMHESQSTFFQSEYFAEGQRTFLGKGYQRDKKLVAFYPCGDWFENESSTLFAGQSIKMMRAPVISAIKETFEDATDSEMTDGKLSEIIGKIDANVPYSQAEYGCVESTYNRVWEARGFVTNYGIQQQAFIPSYTKNPERATEFLRFLVSDEAQVIFSKEMKGLSMPYGFDVTSSEEIKISPFAQSVIDCVSTPNFKAIYRDVTKPLTNRAGLAAFTTNSNLYHEALFYGQSAEQVWNGTYEDLKTNWNKYLTDAGIQK